MCYDCANIPTVAETAQGNIENFNEGLAMVYAEVQCMNQSFTQVGNVLDDVGNLSQEIRGIRANMVSQRDLSSLLRRIQFLESGFVSGGGGSDSEFCSEDEDSHTGYTDHGSEDEDEYM